MLFEKTIHFSAAVPSVKYIPAYNIYLRAANGQILIQQAKNVVFRMKLFPFKPINLLILCRSLGPHP